MADIYATQNGNWDNPTTWIGGIIPQEGDNAYSNTYTITISTDVKVDMITNSTGSGTAGGTFIISPNVSLSANVLGSDTVNNSTCLQFTSPSPEICTLYGNISGGGASTRCGLTITSNGKMIVYGDVYPINSFCIRLLNGANLELYGRVGNVSPVTNKGDYRGIGIGCGQNAVLMLSGDVYGGLTPGNFGITQGNDNSGGIRSNSTVSITGNIYGGFNQSTTTPDGVVIQQGSNHNLFIKGNIYGGYGVGGNTGAKGVFVSNQSSNSYVTILGNIYGGSDNVSQIGLFNNSTTIVISITGDIYGSLTTGDSNEGFRNQVGNLTAIEIKGNIYGGSSSANAHGIFNISSGTIIVYGNVIGGRGGSDGIVNQSNGKIFVYGEAKGGAGSGAHGIFNNSNGLVYLKKAKSNNWGLLSQSLINNPAFGASNGLFNNSINGICYVEEIECGDSGLFPVAGLVFLSAGENTKAQFRDGMGSSVTLFFPESATVFTPSLSDVRFGVTYDEGKKTGTLSMPLSSQVNFGVPMDNTIGSALFNSETVFSVKPSNIRVKDTIGERISFIATVSATNSLINNIS